jgi:hypothetical protein
MNLIKSAIDNAIADAMAEHPKYFTPKGHEHARAILLRKILAGLRGDAPEKPTEEAPAAELPRAPVLVDPNSREALAYLTLCSAGGASPPFRTGDGRVSIPFEGQGAEVLAFADAPARGRWLFISDHQRVGAWNEFFRESLQGKPRRSIIVEQSGQQGIMVPWPWPPAKSGKTYDPDEAAA